MNNITEQMRTAVCELIEKASLRRGDLLIIGCSSSEIIGQRIGSGSSLEAAEAVFQGLYPILQEQGIDLAAQCCEHLNRAVILERSAADRRGLPIVNVVPQPKAGGSFATTVYQNLSEPVAVEQIQADAGMDIGDTFIGMHLKAVAVPVRLSISQIGEAHLTCARVRPKYIGGERACYNPALN